jgi:hypothetical protein
MKRYFAHMYVYMGPIIAEKIAANEYSTTELECFKVDGLKIEHPV